MSFKYIIEPQWNFLKSIKVAIEGDASITEQGADFLDATRMTAMELIQNALKYSNRSHQVEISVSTENDACEIKVVNFCSNPESIESLKRLLLRIQEGDPFELYVERLHALMDHPDGYSRMGLLRIAYEGEFELSLEIDEEKITVAATRPLEIKN